MNSIQKRMRRRKALEQVVREWSDRARLVCIAPTLPYIPAMYVAEFDLVDGPRVRSLGFAEHVRSIVEEAIEKHVENPDAAFDAVQRRVGGLVTAKVVRDHREKAQ